MCCRVYHSLHLKHSPRPLRPTNLRSLNFATWFFITAEQLRSSAQQFSSLPARTVTSVPSPTSPNATTLKATGNVLFDLQCGGNTVHTKWGLPVRTSSPGCSERKSPSVRSARISDVILVYVSWSSVELVSGDTAPLVAPVRCILDTRERCVLHIKSTVSRCATCHSPLHTVELHRNADTLSPTANIFGRTTHTHSLSRSHEGLMTRRHVARERARGHLTRWRHSGLATLFSPVNEKFGGSGRGTRGADFFRRRGVSPPRAAKNFSLVSLTAVLFALRIYAIAVRTSLSLSTLILFWLFGFFVFRFTFSIQR